MRLCQALLVLPLVAAAKDILNLLEKNEAPGLESIQKSQYFSSNNVLEWVALSDDKNRDLLVEHIQAHPEIYGDNETLVIRVAASSKEFDRRAYIHSYNEMGALKYIPKVIAEALVSELPGFMHARVGGWAQMIVGDFV